ncbi:MAG: serine hydrolase, partial [Prevotella sp.]|nr:serine hydrolase [Prevotella sp.]
NRPWIRTGSLVGTSAIVLRYPDGECWVFITNTSTWKGHKFSKDTMALFDKLRQRFGSKMPKRNLFVK